MLPTSLHARFSLSLPFLSVLFSVTDTFYFATCWLGCALFCFCCAFVFVIIIHPYTWAMATPVMSDDGSPEPGQPAPTGTFTYRLPLCEISLQGTSRFQTRAATSDRNGDALLKHDRTFWHWNLKPHYPRGPNPWKQESQRKEDKLKHHQTTFFSKYLNTIFPGGIQAGLCQRLYLELHSIQLQFGCIGPWFAPVTPRF
jgi:hypothetical protein